MARMRTDVGYTLIEILVTVTVMSALMAVGVGGFRGWALAKDHEGAATDIQTILRQTQTRAITEGVPFCVRFDTDISEYTVMRHSCASDGVAILGPFKTNDARVVLRDARFLKPDGSVGSNVLFKPTGTASAGTLNIKRSGSSKVYVIEVEGFTGRVSIS